MSLFRRRKKFSADEMAINLLPKITLSFSSKPFGRQLLWMDNPQATHERLLQHFWDLKKLESEEEIVVVCLDESKHCIGVFQFDTILNRPKATPVNPTDIFAAAVLTRAAAIILVVSNPCGYPRPTPEDEALYQQCNMIGHAMQVDFKDYIIVTPSQGYFSFAERGNRLVRY